MGLDVSRSDAQSVLESTLPSGKHTRIPALLDRYEGNYEQLVRLAELKYGAAPQPGDTLDGSVIREQSDEPSVVYSKRYANIATSPKTAYVQTALGIVPLLSEPNRQIARALKHVTVANALDAIVEIEDSVLEMVSEGRYVYNVVKPVVRGVIAGAKANAAQPRMGMVPIDPALMANTPPLSQAVAPLVRTASSAVGALGRTASKALASLPAAVDIRGEDDNPVNVIGAKKETSDMPPKRGSDLRPEVARAELQRLYE
jgi:hypothetical protein